MSVDFPLIPLNCQLLTCYSFIFMAFDDGDQPMEREKCGDVSEGRKKLWDEKSVKSAHGACNNGERLRGIQYEEEEDDNK